MRERVGIYSELEVQNARDLVREMVRTIRAFRLYEGNHPTLGRMIQQLSARWDAATSGGAVTLRLTQREVLMEEEVVFKTTGRNDILPAVLYDHGIVGFVFSSGADPDELRRFATILASDPSPNADYATLLWEGELVSVQILLDTDDMEAESVPRAAFGAEVASLGDDQDPPVAPQYEEQRKELDSRLDRDEEDAEPDPDLFALTEAEQQKLATEVGKDDYIQTARHAVRIIHALAREDLTAHEAEPLERSVASLVSSTCHTGDIEGALEMLERAHRLRRSDQALELSIGELTLACFLDSSSLQSLLAGLDAHKQIEARALGDLFAQLGPGAANDAAQWLRVTRHAEIVAPALRLFGDAATRMLTPMYKHGSPEDRDRIVPALLEIGTPDALTALVAEYAQLPEADRLKLLNVMARGGEASLRRIVVDSLQDPSERVRGAAMDAVRKADAPAVAKLLGRMLETQAFDQRTEEEATVFFEMLARIGNRAIADLLAEQCTVKGLRRAFMRLTPLQHLCLRSLRRFRDSGAREVVAALKARGPRAVRDVLDDPLADL